MGPSCATRTLALLLELGVIITIYISLHWLRLSTAVAHKAHRTDNTHTCNKWLSEASGRGTCLCLLKDWRKHVDYLCALHMRHSTLHKGTRSSCSSVAVRPSWCSAGRRGRSRTHSNRSASCASVCPPPRCIHRQRWSAWFRHDIRQQIVPLTDSTSNHQCFFTIDDHA